MRGHRKESTHSVSNWVDWVCKKSKSKLTVCILLYERSRKVANTSIIEASVFLSVQCLYSIDEKVSISTQGFYSLWSTAWYRHKLELSKVKDKRLLHNPKLMLEVLICSNKIINIRGKGSKKVKIPNSINGCRYLDCKCNPFIPMHILIRSGVEITYATKTNPCNDGEFALNCTIVTKM